MFDHNDRGHAVCLVCKCNSDDTERRNSRHFSLGSILTKDGWFLSASLLFPHTDVSIYWRLSWRLVAGRLLVIQYTCLKEHTAAGGLHMDGLYVRAGEAGRSLNIRRLDLDTEISYKNVLDSHFPQCTDSQEQRGGIKKSKDKMNENESPSVVVGFTPTLMHNTLRLFITYFSVKVESS